jgi:hypothetical protein
MSGSNYPNTSNFNILPIQQDMIPRPAEGSKGCLVSIYWDYLFNLVPGVFPITQNINLLQQYQTGQFTTIQAVWIDNSTVPTSVTLREIETGQTITCPAFSQGMYPIFSGVAPVFTASLNLQPDPNYAVSIGACTTRIVFINTPQRYFEKYAAVSKPFVYTNNISLIATSTAVNLGPLGSGTGLLSQGSTSGQYYRFFTMSATVILVSAMTAAGLANVALQEGGGGSGPYFRSIFAEWIGTTATAGQVYSGQQTWPAPAGLLQLDPSNNWRLIYSGSGFPVGGVIVNITLAGEVVSIN